MMCPWRTDDGMIESEIERVVISRVVSTALRRPLRCPLLTPSSCAARLWTVTPWATLRRRHGA
jgi:hypothetical protein